MTEMLPNPMHFRQICRICLSNSDDLVNFFNSGEDFVNLLIRMTAISVCLKHYTYCTHSDCLILNFYF